MLRTGQLPAPLRGGLPPPRRRDLAHRRECCYRGPWRLPGPDSHRLAAVSLSLGYVVVLLLSLVLGARAAGRTFLTLLLMSSGGRWLVQGDLPQGCEHLPGHVALQAADHLRLDLPCLMRLAM